MIALDFRSKSAGLSRLVHSKKPYINAELNASLLDLSLGYNLECSSIASAYPFSESVWETCFSQKCDVIVDLTEEYNPPEYTIKDCDAEVFDNIEVELLERKSPNPHICLEKYKIHRFDQNEIHETARIHITCWQDGHGIDIEVLKKLIALVEKVKRKALKLYVHCKKGNGRTGTFLTCFVMKRLIEAGIATEENHQDLLSRVIKTGKQQRSKHFVHTPPQYETCKKFTESTLKACLH